MSEGNYPVANEHFVKAIQLNPRLLDAHYNLATSYFLTGDPARARAGYLYVLEQRPHDLNALYKLASIEEQVGKKQSALRYYERMSSIDPLDEGIRQKITRLRGVRL